MHFKSALLDIRARKHCNKNTFVVPVTLSWRAVKEDFVLDLNICHKTLMRWKHFHNGKIFSTKQTDIKGNEKVLSQPIKSIILTHFTIFREKYCPGLLVYVVAFRADPVRDKQGEVF